MNIGKVFGKILGKSKKKKVINPEDEIMSGLAKSEPECSWFQEFSSMGNLWEDSIRSEKKEKGLPKFRSGSYDFSDQFQLPSANEVRKQLLDAEQAHKLWKIRNRLKKYGLAPSKELLDIELDQRGPHKWDYILKLPVVERYFAMIRYIRTLAAKEATSVGNSRNITSETTNEEVDGLHKKLRLDFTLNSKGEPSNISVGEESTSSSQSESDQQDNVPSSGDIFRKEFEDKLENIYESYWEKESKDFLPTTSVNILQEIYSFKEDNKKKSHSVPSTSEYETFHTCSSAEGSIYEEASDFSQEHVSKFTNDAFDLNEKYEEIMVSSLEESQGQIFDRSKQYLTRRWIRKK